MNTPFRFVVITPPQFVDAEAQYVKTLFQMGLDILHLRKPYAQTDDCRRLLDAIPSEYYSKIVVHDHFCLCREYELLGIHLNGRHPDVPTDFSPRSVSASCHSIQEVAMRKDDLDYVFLSPIFDSISKEGYQSAYTDNVLAEAAQSCIIDDKVIALGGITANAIPQLKKWHFGGAAFLGDVWNRVGQSDFCEYIKIIKSLS